MGLERVNFDEADHQITALIHGDSGAGKTHFAATWPRPLFLSVNDEKGWETITHMDRRHWYEPGVRPQVLKLKTIRDLALGLVEVQEEIKKGRCQTVVIDSISFYCEMFYNGLVQAQQGNSDTWKVYGVLNDHLRKMRVDFHNLNVHVLWLAVTRQPDEDKKVAMPMLKGQQAVLFPAGCKYVWYMRAEETGTTTRNLLHTRKYGNVLARGRDGGKLPNPIVSPNYQIIMDHLSVIQDFDERSEDEIAKELSEESGIEGSIAVEPAPQTSAAKPAVVAAKPAVTPAAAPKPVTPIRRVPGR